LNKQPVEQRTSWQTEAEKAVHRKLMDEERWLLHVPQLDPFNSIEARKILKGKNNFRNILPNYYVDVSLADIKDTEKKLFTRLQITGHLVARLCENNERIQKGEHISPVDILYMLKALYLRAEHHLLWSKHIKYNLYAANMKGHPRFSASYSLQTPYPVKAEAIKHSILEIATILGLEHPKLEMSQYTTAEIHLNKGKKGYDGDKLRDAMSTLLGHFNFVDITGFFINQSTIERNGYVTHVEEPITPVYSNTTQTTIQTTARTQSQAPRKRKAVSLDSDSSDSNSSDSNSSDSEIQPKRRRQKEAYVEEYQNPLGTVPKPQAPAQPYLIQQLSPVPTAYPPVYPVQPLYQQAQYSFNAQAQQQIQIQLQQAQLQAQLMQIQLQAQIEEAQLKDQLQQAQLRAQIEQTQLQIQFQQAQQQHPRFPLYPRTGGQ